MEVNGSRFGDERYRWWDSGDDRVPETNGARNTAGTDGEREDAVAQGLGTGKEGNGTGKLALKSARKILQLVSARSEEWTERSSHDCFCLVSFAI